MVASRTNRKITYAQGFTLIELLTSMAISSIILLFLFGLINQSSITYKTSSGAINTLSESRAFLQFFESDLSSRLPGSPLLSEVAATPFDKIGVLRVKSFDEPEAPASQPDSDVRSSIYYVAFTADFRGTVSPKLYRHYLDGPASQALLDSSPTPTIPLGDPSIDEPIIYNVVSFKAQPKHNSSSGQPTLWTAASNTPPEWVEITIEIIDDGTAARFRTQASWSALVDPNNRDRQQNVRTFTRTIPLGK